MKQPKQRKWIYSFFGILLLAVGMISFNHALTPTDELPVLDQTDPFRLEDVNRESYHSNNQKVKLLAFFYTHCPNICPMTMMDFAVLQEQLKKEGWFGTEVELVAITLDPEVDRFEVIKEYGENFNADPVGWKFLRGSSAETKEIADAFHMKYQKVEGNYIAHNTTMFLIDQDHQIRGLYDMAKSSERVDRAAIMESIEKLVQR